MTVALLLPYIAGFFDGEGSIGLYTSGGRLHYLKVQLAQNETNSSRRVLELICERFGGFISRQVTATGRTKLNWQVSSAKAAVFLRTIQPFLILKAEQAWIATEWEQNRPKAVRGPRGWFLRERDPHDVEVAQVLKDLKKS